MWQSPGRIHPSVTSNSGKNLGQQAKELREALSVDLVVMAIPHMMLLHAADIFPRGGVYEGSYAQEAIRRYEFLWLPLITDPHANLADLAPPIDVAITWYAHRLRPVEYQAYCLKKYGRTVDPPPQTAFAFSDGAGLVGATARVQWNRLYPSEPFYPPKQTSLKRQSELTSLLLPALQELPRVTKQYLCGVYMNSEFLNRAADRYCRFQVLAAARPQLNPVAMVDVELMWRTHIALSGAYRSDLERLLRKQVDQQPALGELQKLLDDSGATSQAANVKDIWNRLGATAGAWESMFPADVYILPCTAGVPASASHPAVMTMYRAQLLAFQSSTGLHAGGHALYVMWLFNNAHHKRTTDTLSLMRNNARDHHMAASQKLYSKVLKIMDFKELPHSSAHRYWYQYHQLIKKVEKAVQTAAISAALAAASRPASGIAATAKPSNIELGKIPMPPQPNRQMQGAKAGGIGQYSSGQLPSSSEIQSADDHWQLEDGTQGSAPADMGSTSSGITHAGGHSAAHATDASVLALLCQEAMIEYSEADTVMLIGGSALGWGGIASAPNPAAGFEQFGWGPCWEGDALLPAAAAYPASPPGSSQYNYESYETGSMSVGKTILDAVFGGFRPSTSRPATNAAASRPTSHAAGARPVSQAAAGRPVSAGLRAAAAARERGGSFLRVMSNSFSQMALPNARQLATARQPSNETRQSSIPRATA